MPCYIPPPEGRFRQNGLYLGAEGIPAAKAASVEKEIGTARAGAFLPAGTKSVVLAFHKPKLP